MGTFTNKVDAKGRVSVPADFRAVLIDDDCDGIICFRSFTDPCMEAGGPIYFEKLHSYIEQMDPYDPLRDAFEVAIIADSMPLSMDKEGRISLTGAFERHADVDDFVTFVGRGEKFQMWNPAVYERHQDEMRRLAAENRGLLQGAGQRSLRPPRSDPARTESVRSDPDRESDY